MAPDVCDVRAVKSLTYSNNWTKNAIAFILQSLHRATQFFVLGQSSQVVLVMWKYTNSLEK